MNLYTFFRAEGFYPLELENDAEAKSNAALNPRTLKVQNMNTGAIVWDASEAPPPNVTQWARVREGVSDATPVSQKPHPSSDERRGRKENKEP